MGPAHGLEFPVKACCLPASCSPILPFLYMAPWDSVVLKLALCWYFGSTFESHSVWSLLPSRLSPSCTIKSLQRIADVKVRGDIFPKLALCCSVKQREHDELHLYLHDGSSEQLDLQQQVATASDQDMFLFHSSPAVF